MKQWLIVIPARLGSTRLPEKPLQMLGAKSLIATVYDRLAPLRQQGVRTVVATDHLRIEQHCKEQDIDVCMTSDLHQSGTDRVWEAAQSSQAEFVMNMQGDEPFINAEDLLTLMRFFEGKHKEYAIGTLVYRQSEMERRDDPACVSAVVSPQTGEAMWFSRSPLPYHRTQPAPDSFWQHMGVYCFHRPQLEKFCGLNPGVYERIESLEQLRAIENGMRIVACEAKHLSEGIDTPEDLARARRRLDA